MDDIQKELNKPLDKKHVSTRKGGGGKQLSYVKGWHVISEMNRIFGHNGWESETVVMKEIVNRKYMNSYDKEAYEVGFMAKVKISISTKCPEGYAVLSNHEGTGTGNGIASTLYAAYESAIKEAETDALKRACKNFGKVMGLALYDTTQANVVDYDKQAAIEKQEAEKKAAKQERIQQRIQDKFCELEDKILTSGSKDVLAAVMTQSSTIQWISFTKIHWIEKFEEMEVIYQDKLASFDDDCPGDKVSSPPPDNLSTDLEAKMYAEAKV